MEKNKIKLRIKGKDKKEIIKNFDKLMEKIPSREVPDWDKKF